MYVSAVCIDKNNRSKSLNFDCNFNLHLQELDNLNEYFFIRSIRLANPNRGF
jgi:hypothetical protein